jgi:hypothetical protein
MDDELMGLLGLTRSESGPEPDALTLNLPNDETGEIEIQISDGAKQYTLKPLADLYGDGTGEPTVDPQIDVFMPLFLAIEEGIAPYYKVNDPGLTDGAVELLLEQLGMDPAAPMADPLALRIQTALRLCLSLNNYSRQEVKAALKKTGKSVTRHTRAAGRRGYLDFIAAFFARNMK